MNYRNLIRVLVVFLAVTVVGIQDADAARRDSLAGNRLIEDRDDVFAYPQLVVEHTNLAAFEYGFNEQSGNGLLIMGNDRFGFGVAIHRGDLFDNETFPYDDGTGALTDVPNLLDTNPVGVSFSQPGTAVDLFAGFDLGAGLAGGRLVIGRGYTETNPPNVSEDSNSQTYFMLQGGFSLAGPLVLDSSLRLVYSTGEVVSGGDTVSDGSFFRLGASVRGYTGLAGAMELGFLGDISYDTVSADQQGAVTVEGEADNFNIQGGAGPVWEIGEDTTIAGYGVLGFQTSSVDANTNDDASLSVNQAILPGFHLAADIQLAEWLYFRSGAQYMWSTISATQETAAGDVEGSLSGSSGDFPTIDPAATTTPSPGGFGWSAGIGIEVDNFRFDGSFQRGFLLNGPDFIGGNTGGLFTLASAEYAW